MSCSSSYAPQLRSLGFRVTSQRLAVLHVLRHASGHLSPREVFARARGSVPGLTAPTVYRTLEFLATNGFAWQTASSRGHLTYELAETNHQHLVCRRCGSHAAIQESTLKQAYKALEAASGYEIDSHHVSLTGLCPRCRKAAAKGAGRNDRQA
jgi:Fur family ferric uptake transcriptional regulator